MASYDEVLYSFTTSDFTKAPFPLTRKMGDRVSDDDSTTGDSREDGEEPHRDCNTFETPLKIEEMAAWQEAILANKQHPLDVFRSPDVITSNQQVFSHKISLEASPVGEQGHSGTCWIFAALTLFRVMLMQKYDLSTFQLSSSYLLFWDKIEKSNHFMEQVLETSGDELGEMRLQNLLFTPIQDGGGWNLAISLVEKYGLVPATIYPDTNSTMDSHTLNLVINSKLRSCALELRTLVERRHGAMKKEAAIARVRSNTLRQIYEILLIGLGPPPNPFKKFTWDYYDKSKTFKSVRVSPLDFAKEVRIPSSRPNDPPGDMLSLVNDPRHSSWELLTSQFQKIVAGGRPVQHINLDMPDLKRASIEMIRKGIPVFFSCDNRLCFDRDSGVMDPRVFDFDLGFNTEVPSLGKADRLLVGDLLPTHAMVITAVHIGRDGNPIRWRCQNSWGTGKGSEGFFVMSDQWMDKFVLQIIMHPSVVSQKTRTVLKKDPIELDRWDPIGAIR